MGGMGERGEEGGVFVLGVGMKIGGSQVEVW